MKTYIKILKIVPGTWWALNRFRLIFLSFFKHWTNSPFPDPSTRGQTGILRSSKTFFDICPRPQKATMRGPSCNLKDDLRTKVFWSFQRFIQEYLLSHYYRPDRELRKQEQRPGVNKEKMWKTHFLEEAGEDGSEENKFSRTEFQNG